MTEVDARRHRLGKPRLEPVDQMPPAQPKIRRYFIDESGNTGDVTRTGAEFDFDRQPIFVLACLGIEDEQAFEATFATLKARHRLLAAEVKSDAAWKKPGFYMDLLVEIERLELPLFLEVVDKKFFIAAQLVNALILPPAGGADHSPESQFMRNTLAEFVTEKLPSACLAAFVEACNQATGEAVLNAYDVLLQSLDACPADGFNGFVRMATMDARDNFIDESPDDPDVVRRYLPWPDLSPSGKPVWMLPHLSSLTNLYARLNTYTGGRLMGVSIVHDEQLQFGDILQTSKTAVEDLSDQGVEFAYGAANYVFRERAEMVFEESGHSAGVQAADVIAGYAMRLLVNRLTPSAKPRHDGDWQLRRLIDQDEPGEGRGTNFVMTTAKLRVIGVSNKIDPFALQW